jgi:hypothetical protein
MMAMPPATGVQIDHMQAELTEAARDAERQMAQPRRPDPETFARQVREVLAREDWRAARLDAD